MKANESRKNKWKQSTVRYQSAPRVVENKEEATCFRYWEGEKEVISRSLSAKKSPHKSRTNSSKNATYICWSGCQRSIGIVFPSLEHWNVRDFPTDMNESNLEIQIGEEIKFHFHWFHDHEDHQLQSNVHILQDRKLFVRKSLWWRSKFEWKKMDNDMTGFSCPIFLQ